MRLVAFRKHLSKNDIERNIEQIMSDMKENTDEHTDKR